MTNFGSGQRFGTADGVVLVGPGWLGAPLAESLAGAGARVVTVQRSAPSATRPAPAGCTAIPGDLTRPESIETIASATGPAIAHLVVCIAPSRTRGDGYAIYPAAASGAVALARALGVRSVLYVSSTGVYDRHDGSEVTEQSPITPTDARVQALHDAEQTVARAASADCVVRIVRPAGLYGPQRDPAARFMSGMVAADTWCNFSWRDDVIGAAHFLLSRPGAGVEWYNCTDGLPVRAGDITRALTGHAPAADAPGVTTTRSHQRVRIDALRAAGWSPTVPSIYEGLRRLGHALPGLAGVTS
jgi:nucleoside-diphosphate-sugar epimerase